MGTHTHTVMIMLLSWTHSGTYSGHLSSCGYDVVYRLVPPTLIFSGDDCPETSFLQNGKSLPRFSRGKRLHNLYFRCYAVTKKMCMW